MKIIFNEYDGAFCFDIEPETKEEAVLLMRMAMNATKRFTASAYTSMNGSISGHVSIGKKKNFRNGFSI